MSRTKYDCNYYKNAKNKAIENHILNGIPITTDPKEGEPKILEIHETDVEKAKESFVQCHIPRNRDKDGIRSKIPSRYFISKTYGQVIRIDKKSKKAFWIKPEYYFADKESRLKVKMNDKKGKYNVPVTGLYGIVFGCEITETAKRYLRKNPLGSFARNGDTKKKEGVQIHHINGIENTRESEGIYDEKEIEIITQPLHINFITKISRRFHGRISEMSPEDLLEVAKEFEEYADSESPNKSVYYSGEGKGLYKEIDEDLKKNVWFAPDDTPRKNRMFNNAMQNPENSIQICNYINSLKESGIYQPKILVNEEPVRIYIIKF